jgi:hypothetical protein
MPALEILAVLITAIVAAPAIAHAAEFPGKRQLNRADYFTVQRIYYPGFTLLGAAEPLALVITALLALFTPQGGGRLWLILCALIALVATHAIFWVFTQPINKCWLEGQPISNAARRFLRSGAPNTDPASNWTALRDQWEYSHLARAALATLALLFLVLAVVP